MVVVVVDGPAEVTGLVVVVVDVTAGGVVGSMVAEEQAAGSNAAAARAANRHRIAASNHRTRPAYRGLPLLPGHSRSRLGRDRPVRVKAAR
jgi:hypothetical protein